MIERFNFYDVYGYLIPGLAAVVVFGVPFVASGGPPPSADLLGAVATLVAAYLAGLVLQIVARNVIPAKRFDQKRKLRRPSDLLLERDGKDAFDEHTRERLRLKIQRQFRIDIDVQSAREAAFIQCRNVLKASEAPSYAEQFDGMYAMMRGLSGAAAFGAFFSAGWLIGVVTRLLGDGARVDLWSGAAVLVGAAIVALRFRYALPREGEGLSQLLGVVLLLSAVAAGVAFARPTANGMLVISTCALLSMLVALWTYGSYQYFADQWVRTVYYGFLALDPTPPKRSGPWV